MSDDRLFKKQVGVTLVEILIAAGLLSLFMTAVFAIYRSSTRSFVSGSWRAEEQKKLQTLISALSRDMSQANSELTTIAADGNRTSLASTPLYVNKNLYAFEAAPKFVKADGNKWLCLTAFSVSYPYIEANATLMSAEQPGKWSGISVWVKNRDIRYLRTGSPGIFSSTPDSLPGAISGFPGPGVVGVGLSFVPDPEQNRNHNFNLSLEEVAMVGRGGTDTNPETLELIFRSARYENGQKTAAEITQNAVVRLASQTSLVDF
ncbi:MAG TPA: hypothetical protein PLM07_04500 [Candidatus Rifleibacterium sp.]|nr:hypothetical protein [Candidatus Rifleibacterium sp.]HPT45143.1 hypothetical protein [Candidatus Rifleibacterium sp.]